ncbi:MAG TPA: HlyC/CorC family transporter [Bacteroidetes bacterium]|nr:HlyC/CorC family transporter [Bacteroidota bacterium]
MEILVIFVLTLFNGFFALSEIALVSVKKARMEQLAAKGSARAKTVLKLLENPENFLSSVQVGITLIGIVSGVYGGANLTDDMIRILAPLPLSEEYRHLLALISVVGSITYFSIVIGELVPKTIAMNNAEAIALFAVPVIRYFTKLTYPFVWLLSVSTSVILKLFRINSDKGEKISEDELRFMLKTASLQGVLEKEESEVHNNLFSFTDQTAKSLMTPRSEVEWINKKDSIEAIFQKIRESVHSKFIVGDGSIDRILGIITIRDFLANFKQPEFQLKQILQAPILIVEETLAFKILNAFKNKKQYIGIVIDEFGATKGIVTLHDLTEAIVGDLPDEGETEELYIIKRADDTYLLDGRTSIFELNRYFQQEMIVDDIPNYTTISGFLLLKLEAIPQAGDIIRFRNLTFEIMDMDKNRIDKVLMTVG